MENISKELNMAEVAFLKPLHHSDSFSTTQRVGIRWFKPGREVKLCGHGSFAVAAILFECFGKLPCNLTTKARPYVGTSMTLFVSPRIERIASIDN